MKHLQETIKNYKTKKLIVRRVIGVSASLQVKVSCPGEMKRHNLFLSPFDKNEAAHVFLSESITKRRSETFFVNDLSYLHGSGSRHRAHVLHVFRTWASSR